MTDPFSVFVGGTALLGTAIRTTLALIEYSQDVKDASKERKTLATEASTLLKLLIDVQGRAEANSLKGEWLDVLRSLAEPAGLLDQYREAFDELAKKLKFDEVTGKLRKEGRFGSLGTRLTWTMAKSEIDKVMGLIQRLMVHINTILNIGQFTLQMSIHKTVQDQEEEASCRSIRDWLSPPPSPPPSDQTYISPGSGKWLLESDEFDQWRSGTSTRLWCSGMPGAGKTVLASIVVDHLHVLKRGFKNDRVGIACVYLNYKDAEPTAEKLMRSLMRQLIQGRATIPDPIYKLYRQHQDNATSPSLLGLSKTFSELRQHFDDVFIIIDALDECKDTVGRALVHELRALQPQIRLLITSRYLESIKCQLEDFKPLEIRASADDILLYIDHQVSESPRLLKFIKRDHTLLDSIRESVTDRAQGMFLLVQLHMQSLAAQLVLRDVRNTLKTLPTKLDQSYDEVMQRISNQETKQREAAMKILSWISYALRPLSLCELQHAITVEPEDDDVDGEAMLEREDILSVCAGLLIIDQQSQTVRLIHYTAQDYFKRVRDTQFPGFHANITLSCVTYLSFKALSMSRRWKYHSYPEEEYSEKYPFIHYAAKYLGDHARYTPETALDQKILQKIRHLLSDPCTGTFLFSLWCSMKLYRKPDDQYHGSFYYRDSDNGYLNQYLSAQDTEDEQDVESVSSDYGLEVFVSRVCAVTKLLELKSAGDQEVCPAQVDVHESQEGHDHLDIQGGQQSKYDEEVLILLLGRLRKQLKLYKKLDVGKDKTDTLTTSNTEEGDGVDLSISYSYVKEILKRHRNEDQQDDQDDVLYFRNNKEEERFLFNLCAMMEELEMFEEEDDTVQEAHETTHQCVGARELNGEGNAAWGEHDIEARHYKDNDDGSDDNKDDNDSYAVDDSDDDNEDDDSSTRSGDCSRTTGRIGNRDLVTSLHLAAFLGLKRVVSLLLEDKLDIDAKDCDGNTAVDIAVTNGFEDLTTFFVQNGASVHLNTQYGQAILLIAVQNDYNGIVDIILDKAVSAAAGGELAPFQHQIHLLSAAYKGDSKTIQGLVNSGLVDLTSKDLRFAQTAICFAVEWNHLETVEILVRQGVDVHTKDHIGQALLHRATRRGYEAMVKLLLRHHAKVDFKNQQGNTAWAEGILMGDRASPNILTILQKAGADSNTKGVDGVNPLYQAAATGQTEVVRRLLESGTDPSITTDFGWAPLHWAAHNGQVDCVRLLLDHHADLSPMSDQSTTPLDMARRNNQVEISEILEQAGAKSAQQVLSDQHSSYRLVQREAPYMEEHWSEEDWSDDDPSDKDAQNHAALRRLLSRRLLNLRRRPITHSKNDGDQSTPAIELDQKKQTEQVGMNNILRKSDSKSARELLGEVESVMLGDIESGQQHVAI